ncbi:MAG: S-layer homology domain-containing protein [Clostridiales bacterium]|nr:S-layer homology domain-containing protein [Clostridiales bacterium]
MNKKLISMLTSVSLCAGVAVIPMTSVSAAGTTLYDVMTTHFSAIPEGIKIDKDGKYTVKYDAEKGHLVQTPAFEVPTDMKVRKYNTANNDSDGWVEGFTGSSDGGTISSADDVLLDYQTIMDMTSVKELYNAYIAAAGSVITALGGEDTSALKAELEATKVKGEFDVTIGFSGNSDSLYNSVSGLSAADYQKMFSLIDAEGNSKDLDVLYKVEDVKADSNKKEVTVTLMVADSADADSAAKTSVDQYLGNQIVMKKEALKAVAPSAGSTYTYEVYGTVTGATSIVSGDKTLGEITYRAVQDAKAANLVSQKEIAATVKIASPTNTPSGGGGGGGGVGGISGAPIVTPKPGTTPAPVATNTPTPTLDPNKMVETPEKLESELHYEYIIGYNDGTVRPNGNITREEVATIFYRMLKDSVRKSLFTQQNNFNDVDAERWSNNAISTLASGGIVAGYEDGSFKPANAITRAEFVSMAARFYGAVTYNNIDFTDVDGHWAKNSIEAGVYYRLISGYSDNTFKPDANITRAEVMTIVNNILNRAVDEEGILEDVPQWSDNNKGDWYYYTVLEATCPHDYVRREENKVMENWTKLNGATDWEALEKSWTTGAEVSLTPSDNTTGAEGEATEEPEATTAPEAEATEAPETAE